MFPKSGPAAKYAMIWAICTSFLATSCKNKMNSSLFDPIPVTYPETIKDSVAEEYFGTIVHDPYRWLEDDRSEATAEWVKRQNQLTFGYLDQIPFRDGIRERMSRIMNFEKRSAPVKKNNHYYFFKNDGLQNQEVYFRCKSLDSEPELVLDPNTFSKDGTSSISSISVSKDEKYLAFQLSSGGSDWNKILVMDLETKKIMEDTVQWVKFSGISWKDDGFYYSRYPEPKDASALSGKNEFHSVYFHKIGSPQTEDELIYMDKENPLRNAYVTVTEDTRFLCMSVSQSTSGNALAVKDLKKSGSDWIWLVKDLGEDYHVAGSLGDRLFVYTNTDAPRWRAFSIDINKPDFRDWKPVISETEDVLQSLDLFHGRLIASYMRNACSLVRIFDSEGNFQQELKLPEPGTVSDFSGNHDQPEAFFGFSSFKRPNTIYRLDLNTNEYNTYFEPKTEFNPEDYTTEQVWYPSKDGSRIPMFITYRKDLKRDGQAPTLLYGYGGFNIPITPAFNVLRIPLLENGGILAIANIRGGGEFGREWHLAGTKEHKQNVFDDFMAAADYLIAEKYTNRDRLALEGRSNGGLLVGACITQRPDLCKVAFPGVGVLDMLRYHKFTIGWAWADDYGTSDTQEGFQYLYAYSPVHNCKPAQYPATLITTADHDDRVVPAHSFKFAASLQAAQQSQNPVLIRIDISAGHGAGKPTSKRIDEAADVLSFMLYQMNISPKL